MIIETQTLIHADIFFFIASVGFALTTGVIIIGLMYMISVLRSVRRITGKLETDIETMEEDVKELISDLRDSRAFRMLFGGRKKRKPSSTKTK